MPEKASPRRNPSAARRLTRRALLPCRKPAAKNPRRLRDGSVIRHTFAPFAAASFRLMLHLRRIVQGRESSRAVGAFRLPHCGWKGKDPRRRRDGSVIRHTFAPFAAASFRLMLHLRRIPHEAKSSPACGGYWLPHHRSKLFSVALRRSDSPPPQQLLFRVLLSILSHTCQGWFGRSIAKTNLMEATKP